MKPGEKYIIEIESVSKTPKGDIAFIKGFKTLVFDGYGLSVLKKFDEGANREAVEAAYRDGWDKCAEGVQATRNTAVAEGMVGAWSMIRTMYNMSSKELCGIFNVPVEYHPNIVMAILNTFNPAEVKKRLDAYEKEKAENEKYAKEMRTIVPGDEVKYRQSDTTFVVTKVDGQFINGFSSDGSQFCDKHSCNWEKTGRHFNLDPLFKFMGRKDDGPEL